MKVIRLTLVMLLICTGVAYAEPVKHLSIGEILISDDAVSDMKVSEVDEKVIEKGRNINLPDVLKNEPGIDMQRRTTVGDTTDSVAIRGFSDNRIMLNINGRPVNAAGVVGGYYIDWSTIPLDNIEKVEIIRGGSVVQYGNNALGGVINVITKKPSEVPTLTFFGGIGGGSDVDMVQNYRVTHSYKVGPLGYSLAGSLQDADEFLWNNDFEGKNIAASIYLDMPFDGEMDLGFQYANTVRGFIRKNRVSDIPGSDGFNTRIDPGYPLAFGETFSPYSGTAFIPGPGATWDKTKYYFDLGYTQPLGEALLSFKAYKNIEDRDEKNYSASVVNPNYEDGQLVLDRTVESDRSYGGSLTLEKSFGDHDLLLGADYKVLAYGDIDIHHVDLAYNSYNWYGSLLGTMGGKPSSEGKAQGYYLEDTWRVSDRVAITVGLRHDRYENNSINGSTSPDLEDDAWTPKLTGTYQATGSDTVTASVYQSLRTPGLPETYWWAAGVTGGNPALKPEKNNAVELTWQHRFSPADYLRLSAYYYSVEDYILFRFDPRWRGVYNIDRAVFSGLSVDGSVELGAWAKGNGSLTWQQTEKKGDMYDTAGLSDEVDYMPEWKGDLGIDFKLPHQSILGLTLKYVGERQTIYAYSYGYPVQQFFDLMKLDSYTTLDANLRIPLTNRVEVGAYVENLLDEEYEEQYGYPMSGFLAGVTLKLSI